VVRLGGLPTSKPLWRWLETASVDQVWVDDGQWRDPLAATVQAFRADPTATLGDLSTLVAATDKSWTQAWLDGDRTAAAAAAEAIDGDPFPSEPAVARITAASAPAGSLIYAGSSMPIRDLDTFAGAPRGIPVLANRGANGIDGILSAAAGAALNGDRVICLTGDIGAIHDMNALVTIARDRLPVTVVVVNNDGGGIFHFLPQADPDVVDPALFDRLFGTPHGVSLVPVAAALGVSASQIADRDELADAIASHDDDPRLVEVATNRAENVAVHRRIREAVAAALG
jgi:2-succinyl-5-enolpyruvyl-6-hydroxy-3-cyclohexene-1-carboxylate synthase